MEEKKKTEKQKEKDGHPGASVSLFKPEMTSFTRGEVGKNLHIEKINIIKAFRKSIYS